jgi:hypothetical protein
MPLTATNSPLAAQHRTPTDFWSPVLLKHPAIPMELDATSVAEIRPGLFPRLFADGPPIVFNELHTLLNCKTALSLLFYATCELFGKNHPGGVPRVGRHQFPEWDHGDRIGMWHKT